MFERRSKLVLPKIQMGNIVEWDDRKGYGFVRLGKTRVFLHRREFAEFHKRPECGDAIRFGIGLDAMGRTCAKNAVHNNDGGRLTMALFVSLGCLLVFPVFALSRSVMDWRVWTAYVVAINILSYAAYAKDKQRARERDWRISENALHLLDGLGGWAGGLIARRRLRHKCSKTSFQIIFWLIVLAHQFVAIDSLIDWRMSRKAIASLKWILRACTG